SPFGGTAAIVLLPHSIMGAEHGAGQEYELAGMAGLPSVMTSGPGGEARRAGGDGHPAPVFGLAGRHRLGSIAQHYNGDFAATGAAPWPALPPPAPYAADHAEPARHGRRPGQAGPPAPAPQG